MQREEVVVINGVSLKKEFRSDFRYAHTSRSTFAVRAAVMAEVENFRSVDDIFDR
jgi:hypothetical protein